MGKVTTLEQAAREIYDLLVTRGRSIGGMSVSESFYEGPDRFVAVAKDRTYITIEWNVSFVVCCSLHVNFDSKSPHETQPDGSYHLNHRVRVRWPSSQMDLSEAAASARLYRDVVDLAHAIDAKLGYLGPISYYPGG